MRKILDVLRLSHEGGRSHREIARAINASPTTVGEILRRAKLYGVTWPLPAGMSEPWLEAQLYPPAAPSNQTRPEPDWPVVHRELRRKGVTLDLLWQEYKAEHPSGYRYSGFCALYRQWVGRLSLSLRQTHTPGEKLFVDYAGPTVPITDPMTGEIRPGGDLRRRPRRLQLHLQRSHLEPEPAGLDRQPCAHLRAPRRLSRPCWSQTTSRAASPPPATTSPNSTRRTATWPLITARRFSPPGRRPKDKAKAEAGVLLVERWVLARLRHQRFFSLI
jgi:hypothetical protein